jgi:hypothetical protein
LASSTLSTPLAALIEQSALVSATLKVTSPSPSPPLVPRVIVAP